MSGIIGKLPEPRSRHQVRFHLISWLRGSKPFRRFLVRFLVWFFAYSVILQVILAYLVAKDVRLLPSSFARAKNLLIVTAHPDDECLFFAPSILGALEGNPETTGGLVVMSIGNNYGIGEKRKQELKGSCAALAINPDRCVALDREELQDNPKVWWDEEVIVSIVKEYVKKWNVDAILTFDEGGISGHINHRAVSKAISDYASKDARAPATYVLRSTSLPRKYLFLLDLPFTALSFSWRILSALVSPAINGHEGYNNKALVANNWHSYMRTRQAFASHDSQYSWDRHLYMILSRQVWYNDLRRVN